MFGNSFRSFFPEFPLRAFATSSGPLVPASIVRCTWFLSNPISLSIHRRFMHTSRKISSQRFCTSAKLKMLWQYLVLKLRCNTFLPMLELWCRISAQLTLLRSIKIFSWWCRAAAHLDQQEQWHHQKLSNKNRFYCCFSYHRSPLTSFAIDRWNSFFKIKFCKILKLNIDTVIFN